MGQVLSCTSTGQLDLGGGEREHWVGVWLRAITPDASCSDPQSSLAPRRDSTSTTRTLMGE